MIKVSRFFWTGWLVAWLWLTAPGENASPVQPSADNPGAAPEPERIVELPPMIILENKPNARWVYVSFAGVEILSACSEETTLRFADIYRSQRELMRLVVPDEFMPRFSVPEVLVLFDQRKGQAMPVELQTKSNALETRTMQAPIGASIEALVQAQLRIRLLPNLMVNGLDAIASCADVGKIDLSYNWTTWEEALRMSENYLRAVLGRRTPALPEWYIDGAVELLRTSQVKGDGLLLYPLVWPHRDERGRAIIGARRGQQENDPRAHVHEPLRNVFQISAPGITPAEAMQLRANRALFVRWVLDGKDSRRSVQLAELIRRSMLAPVSDDMLKACFGQSAEQLRRQLEGYLPLAARRETLLRPIQRGSDVRLKVREASPLEVARIMGDWQRLEATYLAALPEYQERYLAAARKAVAKAYDKGERDPRLLVVSGLIEAEAGNDFRARELLEAAMAADQLEVFRPAAGFVLARLRLREAITKPEGLRGRLSAAQTIHALEPMMRVRLAPPSMVAGYCLIAEAWLRSETAPPEVLSLMNEGVRLFPAHAELVLLAARMHMVHGSKDEALRLVACGLSMVRDEELRSRFEVLLRALTTETSGVRETPAGRPGL